MSGPVTTADCPDAAGSDEPESPVLEVLAGRAAEVGGIPVTRVLPKRARRTVGAWCFVDHFGPSDIADAAMNIGPHPHIGLQTVTWLLDGEVLHHDSLGSEQPIRPGQLNLMTAGRGVSHAEETPATVTGAVHGVQLWVAQPEATRSGPPAFEHHGELPRADLPGGVATILVGELAGARSPARTDTPLVGADLALRGAGAVPVEPSFEHALVVEAGAVEVEGTVLTPGSLAYLGEGRSDVVIAPKGGAARVLLLGGEPFDTPVLMWWNFVARTRDEVEEAYRDWEAGAARFGAVASALGRIPAPRPHWLA